MRSKSIVLLALALGCGLVASIGISQVMERRNANQGAPGETETILVALSDINANDLFTPQNIKVEEWPKGKVPTGAVTKLEDLEGKRCKQKLFAGEPILAARVTQPGDAIGPTTQIPKGYRVVAVRVDSVSGGASLILPGDRIDLLVYLSKNPAMGITETATKTVLEDIKVFAVDTTFQRNTDHDDAAIQAKTVSLLVTPHQAEKVMLATEMGQVRLVLRSPDDDAKTASHGTKSSDITGSDGGDRGSETSKPAVNEAQASATVANVTGAAKSLLDLLKQQKMTARNVKQQDTPWKMEVLNGGEVKTLEFSSANGPPIIASAKDAVPQQPTEPAADSEDQPAGTPDESNDNGTSDTTTTESTSWPRAQLGGSGVGVTLTK